MANTQSNGRAAQSQTLLLIGVQVAVFVFAMYLTSNIIESENGGISALVRSVGVALAVWSFTRPQAGLFIVSIEAFSVDFIKKVAVYYGTVSMGTIIDVLIVTMLAIVATIGGTLIQGTALRRFKISLLNWAVLIAAAVIGGGVLLASKATEGFEKGAEDAFNVAAPIALMIPMTVFLADREKLSKLLKLQFWLAVTWAIWGIRQYYFGFLPLEWFYAETGLSQVASQHMLLFANPRVFGFASGVPNYGVISPYTVYGLWLVVQERRHRFWNVLGTLTLFWGLVTSLQRTALVFPLIAIVFYFCFRTRGRTLATYAALITTFVVGVASAEYLLNHLDDINQAISFHGDWAESVLNVNTFSARLYSWEYLTRPSTYSWLGSRDVPPVHDVFSIIIFSYGVIGLLIVLSVLGAALTFMHGVVLRIADPFDRKTVTFLLAVTVPNIFLGFAGGGNFTSNPTNIQTWAFFGAALTIVANAKLVALPVKIKPVLRARSLIAQQILARPAAMHSPFPGTPRL